MLTDALLNGSAQGLLYRVITTVKAGESFGNLIGTNTVDTAAAATQ
jgi:hypothetical protein